MGLRNIRTTVKIASSLRQKHPDWTEPKLVQEAIIQIWSTTICPEDRNTFETICHGFNKMDLKDLLQIRHSVIVLNPN